MSVWQGMAIFVYFIVLYKCCIVLIYFILLIVTNENTASNGYLTSVTLFWNHLARADNSLHSFDIFVSLSVKFNVSIANKFLLL